MMEKEKLYSAIFKRKSIRKFDLKPLSSDQLENIKKQLQTLEPLHNNIKIDLKILSPDLVKRRMMREAPHYLVVFSENKEGYLSNVGFILQQMDLYFSSEGLASCWQGIPSLKKEALDMSSLEYVIMIPFGNSPEPVHRTSISQFKRKPMEKITNIKGMDEIMEAGRLAPSAGNGQPWFFTGDENMIHAYAIKPGFVRGLLTKKYPPIDVGISLYHLKLAAEYAGKSTEIIFDEPKDNKINEYDYIASLKLN